MHIIDEDSATTLSRLSISSRNGCRLQRVWYSTEKSVENRLYFARLLNRPRQLAREWFFSNAHDDRAALTKLTKKSTMTDFIFVCPDLKSSPPMYTLCSSASSITPGTNVFCFDMRGSGKVQYVHSWAWMIGKGGTSVIC